WWREVSSSADRRCLSTDGPRLTCRRRERGPKDFASFRSSTGTPRPVFVASTHPMVGLLARGSSPCPAFPVQRLRQWHNRTRLPAHSCGGSCGFGRHICAAAPHSLFTLVEGPSSLSDRFRCVGLSIWAAGFNAERSKTFSCPRRRPFRQKPLCG